MDIVSREIEHNVCNRHFLFVVDGVPYCSGGLGNYCTTVILNSCGFRQANQNTREYLAETWERRVTYLYIPKEAENGYHRFECGSA